MVRRKQPLASPFRIYRHFAVVTVVLTAALAVFSDGERREAIAQEIAAREQRNQLEKASQEKFGKPKLVKRSASAGGSFGPDGGAFGEPTDDPGGTGSGYIPDDAPTTGRFVPAAYNHYGLSDAQWAALSEEQREELRRRAREESLRAGSSERQDQMDRLRAASASRAGAASSGD